MSLVKRLARVLSTAILCCLCRSAFAQHSVTLPLSPTDDNQGKLVYHPDPILLIHGINDNDGDCWSTMIGALQIDLWKYYLPPTAVPLLGIQTGAGLRALQRSYVHTFNYGGKTDSEVDAGHNSNSFYHVAWNAWQDDRNNTSYTNRYLSIPLTLPPWLSTVSDPRYLNAPPHDDRETLDERINGRPDGSIVGIRQAYALDPNDPSTRPNVVLVAHSMGGLVAHYYLLKNPADHGVRRLITLSTPHLGSPVANYLWDVAVVNLGAHHVGPEGLQTVLKLIKAVFSKDEVGFAQYAANGAVEDLITTKASADTNCFPTVLNLLQDQFRQQQAPKIEYVFNVFHHNLGSAYQSFRIPCGPVGSPVWKDVDLGDGLVPSWSQAGKESSAAPSIWNGPTSLPIHQIDPVIFGAIENVYPAGWEGFDHSGASKAVAALYQSLDGVPYKWNLNIPPNYTGHIPDYANGYGENQSFSKYLSLKSTGSVAYTDEPGVNDLKLLFIRPDNSLFVPALNTWGLVSGMPAKVATNLASFANHQLIGLTSSGSLSIQSTYGVKNFSQNPAQSTDSDYWIADGNEYLPASLKVKIQGSSAPILDGTNGSFAYFPLNCLVQLDQFNNPQYQYALCNVYSPFGVITATQTFVAVQARNVAGFVTPQAERAFDVPVDSVTVVTILKKINAAEIFSNACRGATKPTRWMNNVQEWVTTDSGTIILNFFPITTTPNARDAWTNIAFTVNSSNYNANTKTITVDPASAPSQLIVSNQVYLGCDAEFTNSYGGIVPALTANTLAGVPIDEAFLTQIRTALNGILHKYQTNSSCVACGGYDLPTALRAAGYPSSNTTWSTVVGGLILPSHITELQKVLSVLTEELHCCCSNVTITLSPSSASATDTNALPDGSSNVVYSTTITAGGTDCPHYKFTVAAGSTLPPGLIITNLTDTSAAITGTPTTVGSNTFIITATDTNGCSTNQLFSLALLAIPAIPGPCPACPVALATYSLTITYRQYYVPENTICEGTCSVEAPFVFGTGGYYETTYTFPLTPFSDCSWQGSADGWIPSGVLSANLWALTSRASSMQVGIFGCAFSLISLTNNSGTPCTLVGSYGATPTSCIGGDKIMSAVISAAP